MRATYRQQRRLTYLLNDLEGLVVVTNKRIDRASFTVRRGVYLAREASELITSLERISSLYFDHVAATDDRLLNFHMERLRRSLDEVRADLEVLRKYLNWTADAHDLFFRLEEAAS